MTKQVTKPRSNDTFENIWTIADSRKTNATEPTTEPIAPTPPTADHTHSRGQDDQLPAMPQDMPPAGGYGPIQYKVSASARGSRWKGAPIGWRWESARWIRLERRTCGC